MLVIYIAKYLRIFRLIQTQTRSGNQVSSAFKIQMEFTPQQQRVSYFPWLPIVASSHSHFCWTGQ
jgi:hypothetical protein